jgi:mannose-6-phosphate isomerase class I
MPLILKTLYIGGPWGGNWIKEIRKLPTSFKNCAWAFDAVANDLSIAVQLNGFEMDIPFNTLLALERKSLMGIKASKRYGFFWPVRVHYDDSFNGGNMALQVHPDQNYVKTHFNEKIGQYEAYYILKAKDNTKVYLGLKDDADVNEFYRQAALSRDSKKVFQYEKFVNCMESATGSLFLIPAGTIHSLGKGQVCLEIGTNYGYTFHIYDYVRPSLNGSLREIHLEQAFNVLNTKMRAALVKTKLKQNPVIIKKLSNMTEKVLGKIKGVPFEVRLIEFTKSYSNSPAGKFHILSLIDGEKATIECSNKKIDLFFTDTVIIPASVKDYRITADGSAKILKVLLKD